MSKRKLPADEVVTAAYMSGMSIQEVATAYGVGKSAVEKYLRRRGVTMRTRSEAARLRVERGIISRQRLGAESPNWKGGAGWAPYRKAIPKERCASCGAQQNLCVHHVDLDHYNNTPDNLQVLCITCHLSFHKWLWWKAKKMGQEVPKSTKPSRWEA